jgi:hypothetical protein
MAPRTQRFPGARSETVHRNRQNLHEKARRGDRDKGADVARVARLGDLDDCRVPDDELDPRGWHVLTRESARPGEVADLIVDLDAMTVCYLEVELDADALRLRGARRVLVPADAVWLNEDEEIVRLDVTAADLTAGSTYDPESLSRAARKALRRRYDKYLSGSEPPVGQGTRRRMIGKVEVRTRVDTEHVEP